MVTCNLCGEDKRLDELKCPFRYVCLDCWDKLKVYMRHRNATEEIDKEDLY